MGFFGFNYLLVIFVDYIIVLFYDEVLNFYYLFDLYVFNESG